jgi:hypothetical protein
MSDPSIIVLALAVVLDATAVGRCAVAPTTTVRPRSPAVLPSRPDCCMSHVPDGGTRRRSTGRHVREHRMLFRSHLYDDIRTGSVTVAFRRWQRPTVSEGGTLQSPVGVLRIDELAVIEVDDITLVDARAAGFDSVDAVVASLPDGVGRRLYRIRFHLVGDDPRVELRARSELGDTDRAKIDVRLDRWDAASSTGPWTQQLLEHIERHPGERSADLAARLGLDQAVLKRRVRQLKGLGLTESLGTGYRLAPRGSAYRSSPPAAR